MSCNEGIIGRLTLNLSCKVSIQDILFHVLGGNVAAKEPRAIALK